MSTQHCNVKAKISKSVPRGIVDPLTAQVVHLVIVAVLFVEEGGDLLDGVAVPGEGPSAGKAHGDDLVRDIGQVEIHTVHLVASLILKAR